MSFGKYLKNKRNELKITQKNFAKEVGIHPINVSKLENDKQRPSYDTILKFADFFKVPVATLSKLAGYNFKLEAKATIKYGEESLKKFGQYFKKIRLKQNKSLEYLHSFCNISLEKIIQFENGKLQPTKEEAYLLADKLNFSSNKEYNEFINQCGYSPNKEKLESLKAEFYNIGLKERIPLQEIANMAAEEAVKKVLKSRAPYPGTYLLKPPERKIPLISGVNCGQTIVLAGDSVELIGCPSMAGKADFAFTARGNSMEEYRIFDGDIIYVKKQDEYFPGNTVVIHVLENGESYLVCKKYTDKRKFVDGKGNEFQCITDNMCNCKVIGVVTATLGKPL